LREDSSKPSEFRFPSPEKADKQGLLAIGGDLDPARVLQAYRQGIFPWYEPGCPILWWSPNPRLLLYPEHFKCTRSLKKSMKKPYELRLDTAFKEVIRLCAKVKGREGATWITSEMVAAYEQLHQEGYAHSLEIWRNNTLVGGLYGISLGNAFFGESMFHLERDASKIALFELCKLCQRLNFDFIDCQLPNPHLQSLGATLVSRKIFLNRLKAALQHPIHQGSWQSLVNALALPSSQPHLT